jgi:hypothetical protein
LFLVDDLDFVVVEYLKEAAKGKKQEKKHPEQNQC